jgi:pimeloyl-ACP methyl ester carboxylesterase
VRQLGTRASDYSTGSVLSDITADTLVIHRRQDPIDIEDEVRYLAGAIRTASLALIEDAGQCTPVEQPQARYGPDADPAP